LDEVFGDWGTDKDHMMRVARLGAYYLKQIFDRWNEWKIINSSV
jgi:hypothetical protein